MLGPILASAQPYLAAETVGVRTGYNPGQPQGALSRQPASIAAQGSYITLLDFRASTQQIRFWLDGDQTSWVVGKTLKIGANTFEVTSAGFGSGVTGVNLSGSGPNIMEDGKGYAVDLY